MHPLKLRRRYEETVKHTRTVQPTRCDVSQFIYFCKTLYMFQTGFPSIIRSSKLHIRRQAFVRPILLPAASLAEMELQFILPRNKQIEKRRIL